MNFLPSFCDPPPNVQMQYRRRSWMDMTIPPPTIPNALGTGQYPRESLIFDDKTPIPSQMRVMSLSRLRQEERAYTDRKDPDYKLFRKINGHREKYCEVCSESISYVREKLTYVKHTHNSSLIDRIRSNTDFWGQVKCNTCWDQWHSAVSGMRYPILATSSTLNEWQGRRTSNSFQGTTHHIETLGIPGAHVQDLHHAFMAEYGESKLPTDVLMICGFNNLLDGQPAELIIDEIEHFKQDVTKILDSSFAACTLPLAPIMTQLPLDNYENKNNLTEEVVELNFRIKEMNDKPGQKMRVSWAPQFHSWGLKSKPTPKESGPRQLLESLPLHQPNDWREKRPKNQLHLSDRVRRRMGKAVSNYFCHIYNPELH